MNCPDCRTRAPFKVYLKPTWSTYTCVGCGREYEIDQNGFVLKMIPAYVVGPFFYRVWPDNFWYGAAGFAVVVFGWGTFLITRQKLKRVEQE